MLIITRRPGEETEVGKDEGMGPHLFDRHGNPVEITLHLLSVVGNQVRMGWSCPNHIPINRPERRVREGRRARSAPPLRDQQGDINGNVAAPEEPSDPPQEVSRTLRLPRS